MPQRLPEELPLSVPDPSGKQMRAKRKIYFSLPLGVLLGVSVERAWAFMDVRPNIVIACIFWGISLACVLGLFWTWAKWRFATKLTIVIIVPLLIVTCGWRFIFGEYRSQRQGSQPAKASFEFWLNDGMLSRDVLFGLVGGTNPVKVLEFALFNKGNAQAEDLLISLGVPAYATNFITFPAGSWQWVRGGGLGMPEPKEKRLNYLQNFLGIPPGKAQPLPHLFVDVRGLSITYMLAEVSARDVQPENFRIHLVGDLLGTNVFHGEAARAKLRTGGVPEIIVTNLGNGGHMRRPPN